MNSFVFRRMEVPILNNSSNNGIRQNIFCNIRKRMDVYTGTVISICMHEETGEQVVKLKSPDNTLRQSIQALNVDSVLALCS